MNTAVDAGLGQKVGSHIRMDGKVFGIKVSLDEVIIEYAPPQFKVWETVRQPKLVVIDHYRMTAQIECETDGAHLTVSIDYNLQKTSTLLGKFFGGFYAKRFINSGTRSRTRRLCRALLSPED